MSKKIITTLKSTQLSYFLACNFASKNRNVSFYRYNQTLNGLLRQVSDKKKPLNSLRKFAYKYYAKSAKFIKTIDHDLLELILNQTLTSSYSFGIFYSSYSWLEPNDLKTKSTMFNSFRDSKISPYLRLADCFILKILNLASHYTTGTFVGDL